MAKYPYIVNKNGKWYSAGTEVPEGAKPVENKKVTETAKDDFSQYMNPPEIEEESTEDRNARKIVYTKTEINRMSTAELKELATSKGIEGAEDMTGADLKKVLIEKFGL